MLNAVAGAYYCSPGLSFFPLFPGVSGSVLRVHQNYARNKLRSPAKSSEKFLSPQNQMSKVVVVFDFDRTIIDGDSDNWVVTQMGLNPLFDQLFSTMPWNSLMNKMMEELHSQGRTVEGIGDCLKQMPLHPHIISAIKSAYSMGCDLRIVSDANKFFIETILRQHQVLGFFTEIITNPTHVDNEGRLRIIPYHDCRLSPPHGCTRCPSNMCKGIILGHMRASTEENGKKIFIYLGDGGGDYCPSLKLGEDDHVMPRKNFPLWKRIQSNPSLIKAKVHAWSNGEELEEILLHLINQFSGEVIRQQPELEEGLVRLHDILHPDKEHEHLEHR